MKGTIRFIIVMLTTIAWNLVIGIVFVEIGVRALNGWYFQAPDVWRLDDELGAVLKPNFSQVVGVGKHRNTVHHNSLGLRGPEVRKEDPELRVFLLGDSYTYGWGTDDSGTVSFQLERQLKEKGYDAEVLNLGVGGFSTVQEYRFLLRYTYLEPDVIVYMFCENDPRDNWDFITTGNTVFSGTSDSFWKQLLRRHSAAFNAFFRRQLFLSKHKPRVEHLNEMPEEWVRHERLLFSRHIRDIVMAYTDSMAIAADSLGALFQIAFIGMIEDTMETDRSMVYQFYRKQFQEKGYVTVPPPEGLISYLNHVEDILGDVPFMAHYNSIYYGFYARQLCRSITEQLKLRNSADEIVVAKGTRGD